jgi:hypothetical protein
MTLLLSNPVGIIQRDVHHTILFCFDDHAGFD